MLFDISQRVVEAPLHARHALAAIRVRFEVTHPFRFRSSVVHDDSEAEFDVPAALDADVNWAPSLAEMEASARRELDSVSGAVLDVHAARGVALAAKFKRRVLAKATKGHFGQGKHRTHAIAVARKATAKLSRGHFGKGEHRAKARAAVAKVAKGKFGLGAHRAKLKAMLTRKSNEGKARVVEGSVGLAAAAAVAAEEEEAAARGAADETTVKDEAAAEEAEGEAARGARAPPIEGGQ